LLHWQGELLKMLSVNVKQNVVLLALTLFLSAFACKQDDAGVAISFQETDQGVSVREGDSHVFFFQRKPKEIQGEYSRCNYIHPLYGLNGEILTENFPEDHLHHRGIFWAWHQLYAGKKRLADGWDLSDFVTDVEDITYGTLDNGTGELFIRTFWKSPNWLDGESNMTAFLEEKTRIVIRKTVDHVRTIDFDIVLVPLIDGFRIGGSEDEKGYGGFSTRIKMPDDLRFIGIAGAVEPKRVQVKAGPWLLFNGTYGEDGQKGGIGIMSHPGNPGHPQAWILRAKRSMQNIVYPGADAVELDKNRSLRLQYRLLVFEGSYESLDMKKLHNEYIDSADN
jgi:hypothetical protein